MITPMSYPQGSSVSTNVAGGSSQSLGQNSTIGGISQAPSNAGVSISAAKVTKKRHVSEDNVTS